MSNYKTITYLLDLTVEISQPIAITGAMRSSNEIGADGLYNFISAIRVATSDESTNMGVMVVFNDEIHTARKYLYLMYAF